MKMPKIISDNGVIAEFEEYEIMKNGNIYITLTKSIPTNVIDFNEKKKMPGYEPSIPVRRVAIPPKKEIKLGLMCPKCHQYHTVVLDNKNITISINEKDNTILTAFLDDTKENVISLTMYKLHTLIDEDTKGFCSVCDTTSPLQEWIDEYATPTSEFFHICNKCGDEMEIMAQNGMSKSTNQSLQCIKCKYTKQIAF